MGSASLVVYLFHGFVVRAADYSGWLDWAGGQPDVALATVLASSIGLSLLLATPAVSQRLGRLVDPVGWLRRRDLANPGQPVNRVPEAQRSMDRAGSDR